MRLALPDGFPAVEIPDDLDVSVHTAPYIGLPGTEVRVLLANGYGLNLLKGRGYSSPNSVEAVVISHSGDPDNWDFARGTGVPTRDGLYLQGWATGEWVANALSILAALTSRT